MNNDLYLIIILETSIIILLILLINYFQISFSKYEINYIILYYI